MSAPSLHRFWTAIETFPGAAASGAEWRFRLGDGFESLKRLLLPTDRVADSIPDASDPYAMYRVVRHACDDIVGVHDGNGSVVQLTKLDVLIYRANLARIAKNLSAAFGFEAIEPKETERTRPPRIGTFRPFAGFAYPVFLAIPLEADDLQCAVETISAHHDVPFILIAPTRRFLRPRCEELLQQKRAICFALSEAVVVDDQGNWIADSEAKQRLATFQKAAIPQAEKNGTTAFFPTPPNATWSDVRIRFVDEVTVSIKVGDVSDRFLFDQTGMVNKNSKKPTEQWKLLLAFAKGYGNFTWNSPHAHRRNQKRRETLSGDLKAFFRIDGDPIEYDSQAKGWRTRFRLDPAD